VVLLIVVLVLVGVVLFGLLAAWSVWFQSYIYSEPAQDLFTWRAPVAGGVLMLFYALWAFLDYSGGDYTRTGRYRSLFEFSASQTLEPFKEVRLFSITDPTKSEVYVLTHDDRGRIVYRLKDGAGTPPSRASKVSVQENGQEVVFEPERDEKGQFKGSPVRFLDKQGRVMVEGQWGQVSIFRTPWLMANLLINGLHLVVWFVCLWLLLRFQWSHALVQAGVAWAVMTLFVVPPILTMAESVAEKRPAAAAPPA
jgi:hypothetical protein